MRGGGQSPSTPLKAGPEQEGERERGGGEVDCASHGKQANKRHPSMASPALKFESLPSEMDSYLEV